MVVTIKEVAEAAGVSAKTVSRVINGEAHVAAAKREAVMRVVRELDYRPNAFARSLSSSRSYLLGLLIDDPASGYAADVQLGAINACRDKSYHLLVERVDRAEPDWARSLRSTLDQLRLDGALLTPPLCDDPEFLDLLDDAGLPYVRITPGSDDARSGFVRMDDAAAAAEMTRHLIALGHRRIGFIAGKPTHGAAAKRLEGFTREMAAHGVSVDPALVHRGDFSVRSGMVAGEAMLSRRDRPSAVFAANDDMALGLLMIAYRHDLDVPGDLAIAGFDDAPTSRAAWPPITTIVQPNGAMAAAAVDILTSPRYRDDPRDPTWRRWLGYRLLVRGSTDRTTTEDAAQGGDSAL
jgi:LacI family transcriptional regulator